MSFLNLGMLIVRIMLGIIFIAHGSQKLFGAFGGSGMEGFSTYLKGIGIALPLFWAYVVALVEAVGGLFVMLGIFPRICAALIAADMLVAIAKVHFKNGFFFSSGGMEYQLLITAVCVLIILVGAGKYSILNRY